MKSVSNILTTLVFISLVVFVSCNKDNDGGDGGPTPEEEQVAKLTGSWNLVPGGAEVGGTIRNEWDELTIVLSGDANGGTIAVQQGVPADQGASDVWPETSTWTFGADITEVIRGDGVTMNVTVTETTLDVRFTISESSRIEGFTGSWLFSFVKSS